MFIFKKLKNYVKKKINNELDNVGLKREIFAL
jgi:hypothetical protein